MSPGAALVVPTASMAVCQRSRIRDVKRPNLGLLAVAFFLLVAPHPVRAALTARQSGQRRHHSRRVTLRIVLISLSAT